MTDKVVLSYFDALIRESDLRLLEGSNWLNDSLISFWFEYLQRVVFDGETTRLLFVTPEVTQLVKMGEEAELPLFLDPLDIKHKEFIFLPVNDSSSGGGSHWSLLVFSRYHRRWFHYDSQRGLNDRPARCLTNRINSYLDQVMPAPLTDALCTQQNNGHDCGAFVMLHAQKAAELALKGAPLDICIMDRLEGKQIREYVKGLIHSMQS